MTSWDAPGVGTLTFASGVEALALLLRVVVAYQAFCCVACFGIVRWCAENAEVARRGPRASGVGPGPWSA